MMVYPEVGCPKNINRVMPFIENIYKIDNLNLKSNESELFDY